MYLGVALRCVALRFILSRSFLSRLYVSTLLKVRYSILPTYTVPGTLEYLGTVPTS